jgi:hypothetical protein
MESNIIANFKKHYNKLIELASKYENFIFYLDSGKYEISEKNLNHLDNLNRNVFFHDGGGSLISEISEHINYFGLHQNEVETILK